MGDGHSIFVWSDAWLPGKNAVRLPTPNLESIIDHRVADVIDGERMIWDKQVLLTHFTLEDVELIREIPLSGICPSDMRYWWLAANGIFSTKTCYWLDQLGHIRDWA